LDTVNPETSVFDKRLDRTVEMTATAEPAPGGRQPILPPTHGLIGSQAMFDKEEFAAGSEDAPHLLESRRDLRDRAQGPGRDDCIDAMSVEWYSLRCSLDKADWHA
jgi:hypothetical protein